MDLLIDTTQKGQLIFELWDTDVRLAQFKKITEKLSEEILSELEKFLKKRKVAPQDLDKILVNPGPGAFSATRTGVAVANALSLAWKIPIVEWPSGKIRDVVLPKYDKMPNITKPKGLSFRT